MNLLRSVFISVFVGATMSLTVYAAASLLNGATPAISWWGLMLSAGAPAIFFVAAFVAPQTRGPRHPMGFSVVAGLGLAMSLSQSWRFAAAAGNIHVWSGICLLGWMIYLRWYSVFNPSADERLAAGSPLPLFNLRNEQGHTVCSSDLISSFNILVFYRGNWCPFCTAQISELAGRYRELQSAGAEVVLISAQSQKKNHDLAGRFDVPMRFFQDPGNSAAVKLGIEHRWGTPMGMQTLGYSSDTAQPAIIISNAQGQIIWSKIADNYRIRPDPQLFLDVIRNQKTKNQSLS